MKIKRIRKLPEIRIDYAWLLYKVSRALEKSIRKDGKSKIPNLDESEKLTEAYRKEWSKYEKILLTAMCDALDLSFYKPVIDVSLAPYFIPQSDPLILSFYHKPDRFVDVLAHELIHVLLTDNNKLSIKERPKKVDLMDRWENLYGKDYDFNTLVHIPVYVIHKHLYLDVLKEPKRMDRDMKEVKTYPNGEAYTSAWDYVNGRDYRNLISELKQSYKEIK